MNTAEYFDFARKVDELKRAYEERYLPEIERAASQAQNKPEGAFSGQGRNLINEAQVRQCLLDPLLGYLGWKLNDPASMAVEDPAETLRSDSHRRFLDYHGKETAHCDRGRSLVMIEAKRPSARLPGTSGASPAVLAAEIVRAFDAIKTGKSRAKNFSGEWLERFKTLCDYAYRIKERTEKAPQRVVITNGEWFIIFVNPQESLVLKRPKEDDILIFSGLDDVRMRSDVFCMQLAYRSLSNHIPSQHPANLPNFINTNDTVLVALTVELRFNLIGINQPNMAARLFARVRTPDKIWIHICKDYDPPFEVMSVKQKEFVKQIKVLRRYAKELVKEISNFTKVELISTKEAEKIASDDGYLTSIMNTPLRQSSEPDVHHLIVGRDAFYVSDSSDYDKCQFHFYGACAKTGDAASPVLQPSRSPPAYFPSGSTFHCAHKAVHITRAKTCVVQAFETHLCCQRCIFLERCWPTGAIGLPCNRS